MRLPSSTAAVLAFSLLSMSGCVRDRIAIFTLQEEKPQLQLKVIEGDLGFSTEGPILEKEIGAALNLKGNKQEYNLTDLDDKFLFCSRGVYKGIYPLSALSITIKDGKVKVHMIPIDESSSVAVNFFNGEYRSINSIDEVNERTKKH